MSLLFFNLFWQRFALFLHIFKLFFFLFVFIVNKFKLLLLSRLLFHVIAMQIFHSYLVILKSFLELYLHYVNLWFQINKFNSIFLMNLLFHFVYNIDQWLFSSFTFVKHAHFWVETQSILLQLRVCLNLIFKGFNFLFAFAEVQLQISYIFLTFFFHKGSLWVLLRVQKN